MLEILSGELQLGDLGSLGVAFWISTGVAVFFGLVAIVVSVYFYRKSRRIKQLAYTVATANLIQDYSAKLSGLKIEYKGKNPSNISVSKVAVWNDGTETIANSDVAEAEPLVISCDSEILDFSPIDLTTPANQLSLESAGNVLSLTFDYLDKNDGGIFQLVHTAKSSNSIHLQGRVKGSGHAVRRQFGPNVGIAKIAGRIGLVGIVAILISAPAVNSNGVVQFLGYIGIAIGTLLFAVAFVLNQMARRLGVVPKRFESSRSVV